MLVPPYFSETILSGNLILQSSHSSAFQQYVFTEEFSLKELLLFNHSRRQSMWIHFIDPAHLQGEISGLGSTFSSPKHIRHIGGPYDVLVSFRRILSLLILVEDDFYLIFLLKDVLFAVALLLADS